MPYGSKKAVTLLAVHHNLRSGSYLCSMVSFIPPSFTFTTVLLSFASLRLSTTFVSLRPSVFQQAIAHSLPIIFACLSACFGFGFVILFAKKKAAKRYAKPLRDTVLPLALRAFRVTPLASARRLLPFPTPSALFRHASPSDGQVCHPRLNCLFWLKAVFT